MEQTSKKPHKDKATIKEAETGYVIKDNEGKGTMAAAAHFEAPHPFTWR